MTPTTFAPYLFYSCIIAIVAVVYMVVLPTEKPFNKWFQFGEKHFEKYWIYRPLFYCQKCFSGQVAFWSYLIAHTRRDDYLILSVFAVPGIGGKWIGYRMEGYSLPEHVAFISCAIFAALIFTKIYEKIT